MLTKYDFPFEGGYGDLFCGRMDEWVWMNVRNRCRNTMGRGSIPSFPSEQFKERILIAEHSPIRILELSWVWGHIPYWVSTEWSRHKFEKYITSQRDDRTNCEIPRGEKPQDSPVDFHGFANVQSLIDAWRKRLCFCATKEARSLAVWTKLGLREYHPQISRVLVPNCIYRGGCPELKPCGHFNGFVKYLKDNDKMEDFFDISKRYEAYDEYLDITLGAVTSREK